jgi:hypothetical protein
MLVVGSPSRNPEHHTVTTQSSRKEIYTHLSFKKLTCSSSRDMKCQLDCTLSKIIQPRVLILLFGQPYTLWQGHV